jgi:hypothetical protein
MLSWSRVTILVGFTFAVSASTASWAGSIPCDNPIPNECRSAPTCQDNGSCSGDPIREGEPCTAEAACMTTAFCKNGVCTGTVPVEDGTECFIAGLEKCYSPGKCKKIQNTDLSFCTAPAPTMKTCPQPSDPCKQAFCNFQTGNCEETDRCLGTFSGCEVCEPPTGVGLPTCRAVNTGGACTDPEGDFNPCTTNDRCVILGADSLPAFSPATGPLLPGVLAAALDGARQVGTTFSFCMGEAGVGPTPTVTPPTGPTATPTGEPAECVGACGGGSNVTVSNVVTMVNIALGDTPISACPQGDPDNSGDIKITEIVTAVRNSLVGCS